jgi:hypothetical protein
MKARTPMPSLPAEPTLSLSDLALLFERTERDLLDATTAGTFPAPHSKDGANRPRWAVAAIHTYREEQFRWRVAQAVKAARL